jgi:hypothetical protein
MKGRIIVSLVLILLFILLIPGLKAYTHSGRTDKNGCHTNHNTGVYHCHNSSSENSHTNVFNQEPKYKDIDNNFVNDYEQDKQELLINLNNIGGSDGILAAETGRNHLKFKNIELTTDEYNSYKKGYEKGFQIKKMEIRKEEAFKAGYALGEESDNFMLPSKYNQSELKEAFEQGFTNGQHVKWGKYATEYAKKLKPLKLPTNLLKHVKEYAQLRYNNEIKVQKDLAFGEGYDSAFVNQQINIPPNIKKSITLRNAYKKGFYQSKEENREKIKSVDKEDEKSFLGNKLIRILLKGVLTFILISFFIFLYIHRIKYNEKIFKSKNI